MKEKLTKKEVGFAQIKNEVLNDKNLSWKAKGLFAYLYSKPDDWDFSMWRIKDDSIDGKESTRIGLKELEDSGYLIRTRQPDGRMNYHLTYHPCSENQNEPCSEKPNKGKSECGKIGTVSNIDIYTNKDLITNKEGFPFKKTLSNFRNQRRIEAGKPPIPKKPITGKQKVVLKRLTSLDYFHEKGIKEGFDYLLEDDDQANRKFIGLARDFQKRYPENWKEVIDWWFAGDNAWCDYHPSNFFSVNTWMKFKNKDRAKKLL